MGVSDCSQRSRPCAGSCFSLCVRGRGSPVGSGVVSKVRLRQFPSKRYLRQHEFLRRIHGRRGSDVPVPFPREGGTRRHPRGERCRSGPLLRSCARSLRIPCDAHRRGAGAGDTPSMAVRVEKGRGIPSGGRDSRPWAPRISGRRALHIPGPVQLRQAGHVEIRRPDLPIAPVRRRPGRVQVLLVRDPVSRRRGVREIREVCHDGA